MDKKLGNKLRRISLALILLVTLAFNCISPASANTVIDETLCNDAISAVAINIRNLDQVSGDQINTALGCLRNELEETRSSKSTMSRADQNKKIRTIVFFIRALRAELLELAKA